ncbi:MAG: LEA type 2 family protein [Bacteroidetes bacterium]|nr:LEA type 2 family protein [Bacteroidota bacterium]
MKMKTIQKLFLPVFLLLLITSCDVTKQTKTAINLANCEFRLVSAENINIAGIPVDAYTSVKDLGVTDFAMFMGALAQPELPLSLLLNIEVKNPNPAPAGINSLDYIIFIDDIQMLQGSYMKPITVPANSSAVIPVQIDTDLKQALKGKTMDAILNFGFNLAGVSHVPTRFKVKLKPSILVGGTSLAYPGYITVKTEFVNGTVSR